MLGQTLFRAAGQHPNLEVYGTVRRKDERLFNFLQTNGDQIFECDLEQSVDQQLYCFPDVVINCAGIIKQNTSQSMLSYIRVNSLAPYILAELSERLGARLIQTSTDCVFSGHSGHYTETDIPDPVDLYGRSKLLGEVTHGPHLTVRTSFIGFNNYYTDGLSLLDWFRRQSGEIKGYTQAIWSGLTTLELSHQLLLLIHKPEVTGLLHLCGQEISKYDLLLMVKEIFGKSDLVIHPDSSYVCNRSLLGLRMAELGMSVPPIRQMLVDLHAQSNP